MLGGDGKGKRDVGVLKASRQRCHAARDAFYRCADELGQLNDDAAPVQCKELRAAYEAACPASWVEYFDVQRQSDVQRLRKLHQNINENTFRAKGVQAGRDLGSSSHRSRNERHGGESARSERGRDDASASRSSRRREGKVGDDSERRHRHSERERDREREPREDRESRKRSRHEGERVEKARDSAGASEHRSRSERARDDKDSKHRKRHKEGHRELKDKEGHREHKDRHRDKGAHREHQSERSHEHRSESEAGRGDDDRKRKRESRHSPELEDGQLPAAAGAPEGEEAHRAPLSPGAQEARKQRRRERKRREKEEKDKSQAAEPADLMTGLTAQEIAQMQALGLPFGFATTQGTAVEDAAANESAVKVTSQRKARQFMNRKGGFNRSLPAERTGKKMQEV